MGPAGLEEALHGIFTRDDPALLVGPETSDDAGVYRIGANVALVDTVDVITPVVDDPVMFGRIAAANALSDVYAMGGVPVTAMNLVFFPACDLPVDILKDILAGGVATLREAGVSLVGGHTVEDQELKYGLAVTGLIDPERVIRNSTACVGDLIFLTKPLGTGIVSTALKAEMVDSGVVQAATDSMLRLNKIAAEVMGEANASAATDVTGFGLIGHACEMAKGAGVTLRLVQGQVPLLPGVPDLVRDGLVPAGCYRNRDHYRPMISASFADDLLLPLFDPQTSGGLLITLPAISADTFIRGARENGIEVALIGEVTSRGGGVVEIV